MDQEQLKQIVAAAALDEIRGELYPDTIVGIGTGTTADKFIDLLGAVDVPFLGAVASSERSAERLRGHGIRVFELNQVDEIPVYVDGADEINANLAMIKGGGGALTREKIVASAARRFVCIADASKLVARLGNFGVPIEVIPMARALVARQVVNLVQDLGQPQVRLRETADGKPVVTDNGNHIIDLRGLLIDDPAQLEARIESVTGVVASGLFAVRGADVLLLSGPVGVERFLRHA